jgi:ADP-heptose:LPS heptosyltransferase
MKILIVQLGKIGDMVLTTPLFRALLEKFPGSRIHVLTSRRGAPVIADNPRVHGVLVFRKDPVRLFALLVKLFFGRYDVWIDPKSHYSRESALLVRLSRPRVSIGFNKKTGKVFSHSLDVEGCTALQAAEINLFAAKPLGISVPPNIKPELFPEPTLQATLRDRYVLREKKTILLNISAGDAYRYWDVANWASVARFFGKKGFRVLLSFTPSDAASAQSIRERESAAELFHSSSIRDVIALMSEMHLVVTLDTSIVHIASAFNIPQVALFPASEWNVARFRPLSDLSIVVQPSQEATISSIPASDVINAAQSILSKIIKL